MNVSEILLLFDYNDWANDLLMEKAQALTPQQLMQPNTFSFGSLLGTLVHILDSEYVWRIVLGTNKYQGQLTDTMAFPTLASVAQYWPEERKLMRTYLHALTDEDVVATIQYHAPEAFRSRKLWHCLVHVVNHGTQHRAECAQMLTDFGQSPGDIDLTQFLTEQGLS